MTIHRPLLVAALMAGTFAYSSFFVFHGLVLHDDGALAQMAERTLGGQVPHRDFDELYTGGLTFFNALVFKIFGAKFSTLRVPLLLAEVASVPLIFALLSRYAPPLVAALLLAVAVWWGPANYFCALPTWYVSILGVAELWLVFRFRESARARFLVAAGVLTGIMFLLKLTGLYFLLASSLALFLAPAPGEKTRPALAGLAFALATGLVALLVRQAFLNELYYAIPLAALGAGSLLGAEPGNAVSLRRSLRPVASLWAGFFLVLAPYAAWLAHAGALAATLRGVFLDPQTRLAFAAAALPDLSTWIAALPVAALFAWSLLPGRELSRSAFALFLIALIALAVAGGQDLVYSLVWLSVRPLVPALLLGGAFCLAHPRIRERATPERRSGLVLLLCTLGMASLAQFPYPSAVYFCYISAFALLCGAALVALFSVRLRAPLLAVATFYGAFAALWMNGAYVQAMGFAHVSAGDSAMLMPERAGIYAKPNWAASYELVAKALREHSGASDAIFAGPDCPEVYFLAGKRNPTRVLFDFLDPAGAAPKTVLAEIDQAGVNAIAVNLEPYFSPPYEKDFLQELHRRFPNAQRIHSFIVAWRSP